MQSFAIGEQELSNVDIYSLYYNDKTDILYAGTNRGVFSYRQNKFIPHRPSPNQVGNSLFQLKEDRSGRLFCCNLVGQVFQVFDDRIELFYQLPKGTSKIDFHFYFDKNNDLIVNTLNRILKIDETGTESNLFSLLEYNKKKGKSGGRFSISSTSQVGENIYFILRNRNIYLTYNGTTLVENSLPREYSQFRNSIFGLENSLFYIADGLVRKLDGSELEETTSIAYGSGVYQINPNLIGVQSKEGLFKYLYLNEDGTIQERKYNPDKFLSTICQNDRGTIFLGTFKEGVIVVPDPDIIRYSSKYALSGITVGVNNDAYVSNLRREILNIDRSPMNFSELNVDNLYYLKTTYPFRGGTIDGIIFDNLNKFPNYSIWSNIKDIEEYNDEMILLINPSSINFIMRDETTFIDKSFAQKKGPNDYTIELKNRGKAIVYNKKNNSIYYATSISVYKQQWNSSKIEQLLFKGKTFLGNDLANFNKYVIVGTESHGLLFYDGTSFIRQLTSKDGLKSNTIIKIKCDDQYLFIQTTEGFQVMDLARNEFIYLGESDGLPASKVINFDKSSDKLWLLEKYGYYSIPLDKLGDSPRVVSNEYFDFDSILVNDKNILGKDFVELAHDNNTINFYFDYRSIEKTLETTLLYKLEGFNKDWKEISADVNDVKFPFLPPGEYTFRIKSSYRGQESKERTYHFTVKPPFWQTSWFILLSILFIIGCTSFIFILRMRFVRKKKELNFKRREMELNLLEAKLRTIRSQMNPHFVFNALNSIQSLVLEENVEKSYDYIEMFGSLVRKTLIYSDQNSISILEEIEFLKIYLNLESLRMKSDFQFTIKNRLNEDSILPTLLIQPFVENAIHHGLLHKQGDKKLSIEFVSKPDVNHCIIQDNGIGRKASKAMNLRQNRTESFSLRAIKNRLNLLSEQENKEFSYEIQDLFDAQGEASGTKVIIILPKKEKF